MTAVTELGRGTHTVAAALRAALDGVVAVVHEYPELAGASVETARGEAYVLRCDSGGYAMEAWRHHSRDAYRVCQADSLDTAVALALEAVLTADECARLGHRPVSTAQGSGTKAGIG